MKVKSKSEVAQSCLTQLLHELQPTRLLRPWDFPGKSTGVGCHCLLLMFLRKWRYLASSVGGMALSLSCTAECGTGSFSYPLIAEKAVAPHSSTLAWKIPWMEEPGGVTPVHGVTKSRTRLSDFTFTFHFHALEKEMATRSSVLAWRIPWTIAWWASISGAAQSRTRLK